MKRDMDLMRLLLIALQESDQAVVQNVPMIDGYSQNLVVEHVRLGYDAGLLTARDASTYDGQNFVSLQLTWAGHEFLESVKDPDIWARTKSGASKVGSFSFKILAELAFGAAKAKAQELGVPMM